VLPGHLTYVSLLTRGQALELDDPRVRKLSTEAHDAHTFAFASEDGTESLLAATATEAELLALLGTTARATGLPATEWFELLAGSESPLLPHVDAALRLAREQVEKGLGAPGSPKRAPKSIADRAKALLHIAAIQRALAARGGSPLPANLLRRALLAQTLSYTGEGGRAPKPSSMDFDALVTSAGWARLTESTCGYPFPERAPGEGHVPLVDVNYLIRSYIEVVGRDNVAADDAIWTVAHHLYEHDVLFVPDAKGVTLDERVRESWHPTVPGATPGPLRLYPAAVPCGPRYEQALAIVLDWIAKGVLRELSPKELASEDECKVISLLNVIFKGALEMPQDVLAAIESNDVRALGAAAAAFSKVIIGKLKARQAERPEEPLPAALDFVLAELRPSDPKAAKARMVFNGRALGAHIHSASFAYTGLAAMLEEFEVGDVYGKSDGAHFFYLVRYGAASRPYLCGAFPRPDGSFMVVRYDRLCMGTTDSPLVASLLSSLIVFIARHRAMSSRLHAYMDDFVPAGSTPAMGKRVHTVLLETLKGANVPESLPKRVEMGHDTEALGLVINSASGELTLPLKKRAQYMVHACTVLELLEDESLHGAVTKASLSSLAGKLTWWSCAAAQGRPHLGGLITAMKPQVRLTGASGKEVLAAAARDLRWWRDEWLAGSLAGQIIISPQSPALVRACGGGADDTEQETGGGEDAGGDAQRAKRQRVNTARTDAGSPGGGAVWNGKALHVRFTPEQSLKSSSWREAAVVLETFRHFGASWSGTSVLLLTDNQGNTFSFSKGGSRDPEVTAMIADMYQLAAQHNFFWVCQWIPREVNVEADALSKCGTEAQAAETAAKLGLHPPPSVTVQ